MGFTVIYWDISDKIFKSHLANVLMGRSNAIELVKHS